MEGLAAGIQKSRGMVAKAVEGVATGMVIRPGVDKAPSGNSQPASSTSLNQMMDTWREVVTSVQTGGMGDIVILVYVRSTLLDELVVGAQTRHNLKSGGRY